MIAEQGTLSHHLSAHSAIQQRASLTSTSLLILSLLLSACGGGGTRGAGGAPTENENARREAAEQQLLGAQALEEQGRLEEAAYAYEHLWRLYPLPRFLILAARTHDRRGARCSQRLAAWRRASQRCAGCRFQEKIDSRLSAVGSCDREVRFISEPAGAIISVRGERLGKTPLTHRLEPGEYQVVATLGTDQQSATLTLAEGAAQLQFTFAGQIAPAPTAPRGITDAQPATAAPRFIERSQGDLNLKVKLFCEHRSPERGTYLPLHQCDAAPLWEDDRFRVQVETNQAAWVYLLLHNSSGQRQLLFPHRGEAHQSQPGEPLSLPARRWYVMDEVGPVTEKLMVVASAKPIETLEHLQGVNIPPERAAEIREALSRGVKLDSWETPEENSTVEGLSVLGRGDNEGLWLELTLEHRGRRSPTL